MSTSPLAEVLGMQFQHELADPSGNTSHTLSQSLLVIPLACTRTRCAETLGVVWCGALRDTLSAGPGSRRRYLLACSAFHYDDRVRKKLQVGFAATPLATHPLSPARLSATTCHLCCPGGSPSSAAYLSAHQSSFSAEPAEAMTFSPDSSASCTIMLDVPVVP
jgi:hypothetical protein